MRAELILQLRERAALLGQQQHARGLTIEPMHELEEPRLRPRLTQLLDHARTHAAAAMHGDPRGLVYRQQMLVFEQHGELARRSRALGQVAHRKAHWRYAHVVSRRHTRIGRSTALVHTHFAAANHAVDMRLGHALEVAQ